MLARHAEDLYWIGRYLERAEDTARMLDVTFHSVLEASSDRTPRDLWSELLEVLFLDDAPGLDVGSAPEMIGSTLLADRENPSSIVSLLGRARENARTVREWLSSEVWESVNEVHLELQNRDLAALTRSRPYDILRRVKAGLQGIVGAVEASMPRSDAHRFLMLGQMLERGLITARVVSVWHARLGMFSGVAAYAEWVKLLKSVSAYEAYLRDHQASMDANRVLQFLIQSEAFPRSVLYCLTQCERQLEVLVGGQVGHAARRSVGRLRAETEFADPTALGPESLDRFLHRLEEELIELAEQVQRDYFRPGSMLAMHHYETF